MTFEFNKSLSSYAQNGDDTLFIRLVYKDNNFINQQIPLYQESRIDDKYYFDTETKALSLNNIKLISFDFYNSKSKQHFQRFELVLS